MRFFNKKPTKEQTRIKNEKEYREFRNNSTDPQITLFINNKNMVEARQYTNNRKLLSVNVMDISHVVLHPIGVYIRKDDLAFIVIDREYTKYVFPLSIVGDITSFVFSEAIKEIK